MAWRRTGDKPLSEPMMVSLLTHICVTRPQWVKVSSTPRLLWLFCCYCCCFISTVCSVWQHRKHQHSALVNILENSPSLVNSPHGTATCCTNPTMHHFVTEMCTHVHISVTKWCVVGYLSNVLCHLWDVSIVPIPIRQPWRISINESYKSSDSCHITTTNKTKHNNEIWIFYGI